jgi:PST family polysaccharide transporter
MDIASPTATEVEPPAAEEPRSDGRSAEELTELTARGLPWMTMSRIGSEIVLLLSTVVLARLISPQDFGAFAVALIVAGLALAVPTAGVGMALVQRDVVTHEHLQTGSAISLMIAVVVGSITLVVSYVVIDPLIGMSAGDLIRLACPMFLLFAVGTVPAAMLQRRLNFRRLAIMEVSGNCTRVAVSVGAAVFAGLGGSALVLGLLAGTAMTSGIAITGARPPLPRFNRARAREISEFGLPAALAAVAWTGFANGDYAVIAARLGTAAAGQYWRAYTLAVGYQSKVSILMQSMAFPLLSRSATTEDLFALRARIVRLLTVVLFPVLTGLAITAPIVVPIAYGDAWRDAIVPTQVLCLGGAATLVINAIGSVLMAMGRAKALLGYGVAHFVVYVGSVVVVAQFGLVAVAIDGAIVHGAFAVVAYAMIARRRGQSALSACWQDIRPATLASLGMAIAAVPVNRAAQAADVGAAAQLCAVFVTCAFAYLLTVRVAFEPAWQDLVRVGRRLIPGRVRRLPTRFIRPAASRSVI